MIVAVCGKGGVGTSTVSLNLGRELDAVVVDADLATPDLPRGSGPTLHDVLADRADPTAAVSRIGSVDLLPSGRTLSGARAADLSALPAALERLERDRGRVVVDCPSGLARDVGVALAAADGVVLVTTPDAPAVSDAVRTRRLARSLGTPVASVALNRVADPPEAPDARVRRALGAPPTVLEERPVVDRSRRRGRPVRDVDPDCSACERFRTLARTVARRARKRSSSGAPLDANASAPTDSP